MSLEIENIPINEDQEFLDFRTNLLREVDRLFAIPRWLLGE